MLTSAPDWELFSLSGDTAGVPDHVVTPSLRPHVVMTSVAAIMISLMELTV